MHAPTCLLAARFRQSREGPESPTILKEPTWREPRSLNDYMAQNLQPNPDADSIFFLMNLYLVKPLLFN